MRAGIIVPEDLPEKEIALLGGNSSQRIDALVHDLVNSSWQQVEILQSPPLKEAMDSLRTFLFERVYIGLVYRRETERVNRLVESLFSYYLDHPDFLPGWDAGDNGLAEKVADYIAGMTDRFAIRTFKDLFLPSEWNL